MNTQRTFTIVLYGYKVAMYDNGLLCLTGYYFHNDQVFDEIRGWLKCRQRYAPIKDKIEFFYMSEKDCLDMKTLPNGWPQNPYFGKALPAKPFNLKEFW
jgi:hypothetical protein